MRTSKVINVLIVDDSVLFRSQIQQALKDIPEINVAGVSSNGQLALERMASQDIDVCILDIEMPILDGIETLREMKTLNLKTRVIMFSSQSIFGADKTLEALRMGAIDFVPKPISEASQNLPFLKIQEVLLPKILSLFPILRPSKLQARISDFNWHTFRPKVLVIASSTGGPNALVEFFKSLQDHVPFPILIVQHMPALFTASLAERLGAACGKKAAEGIHGEPLLPNQIYVAPGNFHMRIGGDIISPIIQIDQDAQRNFVRPCADHLFESAVKVFGRSTLGIVFTGMGRDGAEGANAIKTNHGAVLIQNLESSVVFGMPGAVFESGHYDFSSDPQGLAKKTQDILWS